METLAELGKEWGYDIRAVYDGLSALEVARTFHPHLVLLDIGLPEIDGYEVARRLRQDASPAHVRLVALTGYGSAEDRERSREAGFDHHLTKPTDPQELERLLTTILVRSSPDG